MVDLSDFLPAEPAYGPVAVRATVTKAPASLTDSLEVVLTNYSAGHPFEVPAGQWMGRGTTLPAVNDRCLVAFDDHGDAWVPAWIGIAVYPAGGGGGDLHYVHTQGVASATWTVSHGLGKYPSVTVLDSLGDQLEAEVDYTSTTALTIHFAGPTSGSAILN
jgi:hypothetical protein